MRRGRVARWWAALGMALALMLAGCGAAGTTDAPYGGALNHVHDLLALRGMPGAGVVLLATHIGLYRTSDGGNTWIEVAGGAGQTMDGLMLFKLAQSPVDTQRVYVLAIPRTGRPQDAKTTPGLYTSADAGKTWKMATAESTLPTQSVFTIGVGSASAGQVYTLIPALAQNGLYTSDDIGAHWRALPALPDAHPTGVMGDPSHPGRILMWSASTGLYTSDDQGKSWHAAPGTQNGIFSVSLAGATIYASGSDGTFVSTDDGAHYTLVNTQYTFSAVVVCASEPTHAYALAGTAVYATSNGGHTWTTTAATSSHPGNLAVDPAHAGTAYVGFSYPVGVETTTNAGAHWAQVLP